MDGGLKYMKILSLWCDAGGAYRVVGGDTTAASVFRVVVAVTSRA